MRRPTQVLAECRKHATRSHVRLAETRARTAFCGILRTDVDAVRTVAYHSRKMPTALIRHRDCLLHDMGQHHPECPDRLHAIEDQLIASGLAGYLEEHDAPLVGRDHLIRVHSAEYLDALESARSPDM